MGVSFQCAAQYSRATVNTILKVHNEAPAGFVASVDEPSTCKYHLVFVTPLACAGVEEPKPPEADATPTSLLARMRGKCVHRTEGWWQYELCHERHLIQFHVEGESTVAEFF